MRFTPLIVLGVSLCASASFAAAPATVVDPTRITAHVKVLSADDFEGRGPATRAEARTVDYLVQQLQAMGVQPGGDLQGGARLWTQDVPLQRAEITGPLPISVRAGGDAFSYQQGEQMVIRAAQTGTHHVNVTNVPLVFVGYGVHAPERNWDDYKNVDLKGRIALVLVNDPDYETGDGDFGGKAMTYYGRWTYKFEEAARRGAAGVFVIHETGPASYGWATPANSDAGPTFDVVRDDPLAQHTPVEAWIHRDAAVDLFRRAGLDFERLKTAARQRDFKPVTLANIAFSTDFDVRTERVVSKNVVGVLPGTSHPDERIIYTAHWDHLGIGRPDSKGDRIYNGAVDNAAGVAQVLEIARAFGNAPRTPRTIQFLFVTAEEKNLLGTEYYASRPLYPLATTVANLNTDSPRPTSLARNFSTAGDGATTLQDELIATGRAFGRTYSPDPSPGAGRFFRSDHFALAKRGVPAISYKSGDDLVEGGKAAARSWDEAYTRDKYHQPADEFGPAWRSDGIAGDAELLYALGRNLATSRIWPSWKPDSEFKAARDASAASRKP